ncbi:unnamed protein product, partial [Allacma fusca]
MTKESIEKLVEELRPWMEKKDTFLRRA